MHTGGQPLTFQPFPVLGRRKYVRPYGTAGPGQAGVVGLCSFNLQQLVVQEKQHCQLYTSILWPPLLSSLICHQHCHCHRTLYRKLPLTDIAILDALTQWNTSATSHVLYTYVGIADAHYISLTHIHIRTCTHVLYIEYVYTVAGMYTHCTTGCGYAREIPLHHSPASGPCTAAALHCNLVHPHS